MGLLAALAKLLRKYIDDPASPSHFTMVYIGKVDKAMFARVGFKFNEYGEMVISKRSATRFLEEFDAGRFCSSQEHQSTKASGG